MRFSVFLGPLLAFGCAPAEESLYAQDQMVVYGVLDTAIFLYDQNLIGLPTGAQDVTADCPLGGTVHIVGETSEGANATVDLTLTLAGCSNSGDGYDFTLDGDLHWSGSFRTSGYKALSTTSESLGVLGDVQADPPDVDADCPLAVTDRGEDGQASSVSGEWCGRDVQF